MAIERFGAHAAILAVVGSSIMDRDPVSGAILMLPLGFHVAGSLAEKIVSLKNKFRTKGGERLAASGGNLRIIK